MDDETYKQLKDKPGLQPLIEKIKEEHSKELKNKSGLSHFVLSTLVASWSVVWGATLIAMTDIKWPAKLSFVTTPTKDGNLKIAIWPNEFLFWAPIYAFTIWAIGCLLIIVTHRVFTDRAKS